MSARREVFSSGLRPLNSGYAILGPVCCEFETAVWSRRNGAARLATRAGWSTQRRVTAGNDVELGVRNDLGGAFPDRWWAEGVAVAPDQLDGLRDTGELCLGQLYLGSGPPEPDHGVDQLGERRSHVRQLPVGQEQLAQLG